MREHVAVTCHSLEQTCCQQWNRLHFHGYFVQSLWFSQTFHLHLWCGPACPSFWTWCRSGVHSFWCARYSSFPRHTVVHISYTLSSRPNFSICMWCVWSRIVDRKFSFGINCLLLFASSTWSVCYYTWCFQCLLRWGRELVWPDLNEPGGLSGSFQKKYKYIPCGTKTSSNKNSSHCVWSKKDGMRIFPQKVSA